MAIYADFANASRDEIDSLEVKDNQWIKKAFFRTNLGGSGNQRGSRRATKNVLEFSDTTLGGSKSINPPPQFCRIADPKDRSILSSSKGEGRYYRRAFTNFNQRLSLTFGIPDHNPLSRYMSTMFSPDEASVIHTGKVSVAFKAGYAIGFFFTLPFQAFFGLHHMVNRVASALSGNPYSKFYYLKPQMPFYWNAVTMMFNKFCVDSGLFVGANPGDLQLTGDTVSMKESTANNLGVIGDMFPDFMRPVGDDGNGNPNSYVIDVKGIAGRYQRRANLFEKRLEEIANNISSSSTNPIGEFYDLLSTLEANNQITQDQEEADRTFLDMPSYIEAYAESPLSSEASSVGRATAGVDEEGNPLTVDDANPVDEHKPAIAHSMEDDSLSNYLMAELRDGSLFTTFDVDYTGSYSASFSNSTKAIPLKETANAASSAAKDVLVSFAGGNLTDNVIGDTVETVLGGVSDLMLGGAASVGLSGLGALVGLAYVDMPNVVDQPTASLPTHTYKMRFYTHMGDKFSVATRVILPTFQVLAGVLPRRTGKGTYAAPFICRAHCQGVQDDKLCVVDSVTIEVGTGNIGRTVDNLPTVIDVTLGIQNLDDIMPMPVTDNLLKEVISFSPFDEDTVLGDFITTLAGTSLHDQFYMSNRATRAWRLQQANWASLTSPAFFAQEAANSGLGKLAQAFVRTGAI